MQYFSDGTWQRLLRFWVSGAISQVAYYSVFIVSIEFFNIHYITAALLAFVLYFCVNFMFVRNWAFQSTSHWVRDLLRYVQLHTTNQLFGIFGLWVLIDYFFLHYLFAQILMTGVYFCINWYFSHKIFIMPDS